MDYTDIFRNTLVQIVLTILAAIALQFACNKLIRRLVHDLVHRHDHSNRADEKKREKTLITILHTVAVLAIWIAAAIAILTELDVNVAAIMTGAGVVGIIVGLGAQSTIGDILAGMFIILENQYRVGDIVTLSASGKEISGVVEDITIRITRLRDLDGNLHTVRNGLTTIVTNQSFGYANVNVDISVSYGSDIDTVERVINDVGMAMARDEKWQAAIKEPIAFFRVDEFEDSGIRIKALGKVEPAMQWDVAGEFRRRLKKAFEASGITIALPQIVIHK